VRKRVRANRGSARQDAIQTAVPSASIYFELLKRMGDRIDRMSAGRVKMEFLPDGAVVPAFEILDAVDKGIVEGGYAWTHYWSGKNPTAGLFSNPMAARAWASTSCRTLRGSTRAAATTCTASCTGTCSK
jgi:TRAP-type mannitol/chloroaromatic compound transport system substrate-binding protein